MANNPKERQAWILDELKLNPTTTFGNCFSKYYEKFSKSEVTFSKDWNVASDVFKEYQIKAKKAKDDASIELEVDALKSGLKSKIERQMILQEQIDKSLAELENDDATDLKWDAENKIWDKVVRPLTVREKAELRKVVKELQSEISKMEGDYAPIKSEHEISQTPIFSSNGLDES